MEWHSQANNKLKPHESVGNHPEHASAQKICKKLRKRYNVTPKKHNISTKITLPNSKAVADVLWNDAKAAFTSLLSDPRIVDSDYLFFGNNPFAPPPSNISAISDLNTGLACTETYKQRITKPGKQVLLPVTFYLDGATTGQFSALSIEALKFSLGIFTRKARQKDHMWRILGYIPQVTQHKSRGRRVAIDSRNPADRCSSLSLCLPHNFEWFCLKTGSTIYC